MRLKPLSLLGALVLILALAAPAAAQNPTQDAYGGVAGEQQSSNDGGSGDNGSTVATREAGASVGGGSLPFTGLEVGVIVLLAGALVGTGFVLRRASRGTQAG